MPRSKRVEPVLPKDPEIERTARQLRKAVQTAKVTRSVKVEISTIKKEGMAERIPMRNLANPTATGINLGARGPKIDANNFELRYGTIQLVQQNQFGGAPTEDPHSHLRNFEKICSTIKMNGVEDDSVRLRLFPFSLRDRAATWEENLPKEQIKTWDKIVEAFLHKFFPPGRTAQLMAEITHFAQWDQESLYEAWERYKDMLKRCPHHGLQGWVVIQTFFGGLHPQYKNDITAAAGGALMNKTYEEATELIEDLAEHSYATPRSATKRVASIHEVEELKAIKAQLAALTNQLKETSVQPSHPREEGIPNSYPASQEAEQVQYIQNRNNHPRNDPFSNTYNEGWRKHPNLSWNQSNQPRETMGNQPRETMGSQQQSGNYSNFPSNSNTNNTYRPPGYQQRRQDEGHNTDRKPGIEDIMMKFMSKIENTVTGLTNTVGTMKSATDQNNASIQILERQIGQIADALQTRAPGQFPSQTEKKQEDCKAIHLRSGKELIKDPTREPIEEETVVKELELEPTLVEEVVVEDDIPTERPKNKKSIPDIQATKPTIQKIPFPNRLKSHKDDVNFAKFLEVFKKLHINIPFADALAQMPSYVKFLKDILSNKRKIEEHAMVALTEECSAILQHKLPPKLKDPGSFTIPVHIGNSEFSKALCDLGASINLMPLQFSGN